MIGGGRLLMVVGALSLGLSACSSSASRSPSPAPSRSAAAAAARVVDLRDAAGTVVATATLAPAAAGAGVAIHIAAVKLPPGSHGLEIAAIGRCDPPGFASAGAELNPSKRKHGLLNPAGPQAGDLPDLQVGPDGRALVDVPAPLVSLDPASPASLAGPSGSALLVHALRDDQRTDPDGGSGARIACGVISPQTPPSPPAGAQPAPAGVAPGLGSSPGPTASGGNRGNIPAQNLPVNQSGNIPAQNLPVNQSGNIPAQSTPPPPLPKCKFPEPTPIPPHPSPCTP